MSINDLFIKNNYKLIFDQGTVTDTLTVDGDLTVLGTIHGNLPPGPIIPGAAGQFLRTNNLETAAIWQSFTPSMIPVGANSQVLTTVSGVAAWAAAGNGSNSIGSNIIANSVLNATAVLQSITIGANTYNGTLSDAIRFVQNGTINSTGVFTSNTILFKVNAGTISTFTFMSTATLTGSYSINANFICYAFAAPNASWYFNVNFVYTDSAFGTITQVSSGIVTTNVTNSITLRTDASPASANTTITSRATKAWKE